MDIQKVQNALAIYAGLSPEDAANLDWSGIRDALLYSFASQSDQAQANLAALQEATELSGKARMLLALLYMVALDYSSSEHKVDLSKLDGDRLSKSEEEVMDYIEELGYPRPARKESQQKADLPPFDQILSRALSLAPDQLAPFKNNFVTITGMLRYLAFTMATMDREFLNYLSSDQQAYCQALLNDMEAGRTLREWDDFFLCDQTPSPKEDVEEESNNLRSRLADIRGRIEKSNKPSNADRLRAIKNRVQKDKIPNTGNATSKLKDLISRKKRGE